VWIQVSVIAIESRIFFYKTKKNVKRSIGKPHTCTEFVK
jgi:hypothetical protein